MKSLGYYYSKFFKKIVRGKSILDSLVDHTAVVNSGDQHGGCHDGSIFVLRL